MSALESKHIVQLYQLEGEHFGFLVVATVQPHWMDFKLYEIISVDAETNKPDYQAQDADHGMDFVDDYHKAAVWAEGYIKWDGCQEWELNSRPHFCGSAQALAAYEAAVNAIYAVAKMHMERFAGD